MVAPGNGRRRDVQAGRGAPEVKLLGDGDRTAKGAKFHVSDGMRHFANRNTHGRKEIDADDFNTLTSINRAQRAAIVQCRAS